MDQKKLPHSQRPKIITKRRLIATQKEYLIEGADSKLVWKKQDRTIKNQAKQFDEAYKDILRYFPAEFEIPDQKVKIYYEDKDFQIVYNDKPVTVDSNLTKKARIEILTKFNIMFPLQLFESMYLQGLKKKRTQNLIQEIFQE